MVKTVSESEMLIDADGDLIIKDRYAFRPDKSGPQIVTIQYAVPIRVAKARDKLGQLQTALPRPNIIQVHINRKLQAGQVHAIELQLLIAPEAEDIGNIQMVNWGSLSLKSIKTKIKPFQVLGFNKMKRVNDYWVYSDNQSTEINSNIARFRPSRIEFGSELNIIITKDLIIDLSAGTNLREISVIGPTVSKRQNTTLLTPGVEIIYDNNKNPRYRLKPNVNPGDIGRIQIQWQVRIPNGFENTKNFGSMQALRKVTSESSKYQEYLQPSKYWEVNHPAIQKLVNALPTKKSIFNNHRLLFEFVNRNLNYVVTNNRQTAIQALQTRQGDCSEFADLLTTLHRAIGIPSRVVEGIILENDKKKNPEFHAWVEFMTTKGWVASDPTWGILSGITSQHIEFSHQKMGKQSSLFSIEYTGPRPNIKSQISWNEY